MEVMEAKQLLDRAITQIETVIVGKREVIQLTLTALLADGHVLFEDIPGVGKTKLAHALSRTFSSDFQRIQFTADLLPTDIIGVSIFNQKTTQFEFQPGPIFTTYLLADELNRSTPRTQAALLEAMGERRVTIDGVTHALNRNFFVLATQNPTDYAGTYPLPEAQLDRFLMRLSIGYPNFESELQLLEQKDQAQTRLNQLQPVIDTEQLAGLKQLVATVIFDDQLLQYVLKIVTATRQDPRLRLGVSPRGSLAIVTASRALALTFGRQYVTVDDIQTLVPLVFAHRLLKQAETSATAVEILQDIMQQIPAPITR